MKHPGEMPDLSFTLPVPVSANRMYLHLARFKGGKQFTPEYRAWRDRAGWLLKMQRNDTPAILGRFKIEIDVPHNAQRDLDNYLKPLLDLLQRQGVIRNDRGQRETAIRYADRDDVLVKLWDLGGPELPAPRLTLRAQAFKPRRFNAKLSPTRIRRIERARYGGQP